MSVHGVFGVMDKLEVISFKDGLQAAAAGYNYPEAVTRVEIVKVVIVRDGTISGRPTVDFLMEDEDGRQYVVMLSGRLLKSIPCDPS